MLHAGETGRRNMPSDLPKYEIDDRIAILRDNLRQLVEQAAAQSGAADESRTADRIAQMTEELNKLVAEREALGKR
jgi:uncharacterized small protein (DUF1192 family)